MRIIETVLCAAFLTGCAPKGNSNPNINLERAQQTLDSLYVHYSVPNTCLLRENFPFDEKHKVTYLASEEQAKRRNEYSYLWPYSGTFSAVNALLESTGNKKYKKTSGKQSTTRIGRILRHTKRTIRLLILYQQSTSLRSFL